MLSLALDGYIAPGIPTLALKPPSGPDWVHEIKHDGYRLSMSQLPAGRRDEL
jgi:bifunctional non-homologous end joining protein LigD